MDQSDSRIGHCVNFTGEKIKNQTARDLPKSIESQKYHKIGKDNHSQSKHLHQHAGLLHSVTREGQDLGALRETLHCVQAGVPMPLAADREMLVVKRLLF
jgi:hypothetical protein